MQNNNTLSIPGNIIRKLRRLRDVKQSAIASKLGCTQQAYSKIECSKKLSEHKILALLKALGSSEEELKALINFYPPEK